jgi:hypothetical protein
LVIYATFSLSSEERMSSMLNPGATSGKVQLSFGSVGGGRFDKGVEFVLLIVNGVKTFTETQIVTARVGPSRRGRRSRLFRPGLESGVGDGIAFLGDLER